ncbi:MULTISPECIES: FMN-binding protein [unclassified Cryobacterium]|uniref:FMN-binding protein n=1 Tax=unclassified Cryobacterium TaxID=2649013 RepID=UPI0018E0AA2F|nr:MULTISPECIES: FMN-binding protein [unclassified Cryobacterium]
MRIRAAASAALASVSVLAIGWMVGAPAAESLQATLASATTATTTPAASTTPAATSATTPSATTPTAGTGEAAQAPAAATAPVAATPAGVTGTFDGSVVQTRFGNVQVSVTIDNGTITEVSALHLTDHDPRSVAISNQAAPILRSEVLTAQSARVQNVSGATYTTAGYLQSMQAALDAAQF